MLIEAKVNNTLDSIINATANEHIDPYNKIIFNHMCKLLTFIIKILVVRIMLA